MFLSTGLRHTAGLTSQCLFMTLFRIKQRQKSSSAFVNCGEAFVSTRRFLIRQIVAVASIKVAVTVGVNVPLIFGKERDY